MRKSSKIKLILFVLLITICGVICFILIKPKGINQKEYDKKLSDLIELNIADDFEYLCISVGDYQEAEQIPYYYIYDKTKAKEILKKLDGEKLKELDSSIKDDMFNSAETIDKNKGWEIRIKDKTYITSIYSGTMVVQRQMHMTKSMIKGSEKQGGIFSETGNQIILAQGYRDFYDVLIDIVDEFNEGEYYTSELETK